MLDDRVDVPSDGGSSTGNSRACRFESNLGHGTSPPAPLRAALGGVGGNCPLPADEGELPESDAPDDLYAWWPRRTEVAG